MRGAGSAPPQVKLDDNEVGGRQVQIRAEPRKLDGCDVSGSIGVVRQIAAVGIVDDAVVIVVSSTRRTLEECAECESAVVQRQ